MEPLSLSSEGCCPPLLECCGSVMLIDGFIQAPWKAFGEMPDSERVVDVKVCVADELFEFRNVAVRVLRVHFESFHDDSPCLFFLQNVGVLSMERCDGCSGNASTLQTRLNYKSKSELSG